MNLVEQVRAAVADVPKGHVTTYGDIAAQIGVWPRQVGRVMSVLDDGVPWWRVIHADGAPATCHDGAASALLQAEGVPFRGNRVDLRSAREVAEPG